MAREIVCPEGERTRVLHLFSDSVPQTVRFAAEARSGDGLDGVVEIERSGVIGRTRTQSVPLAPQNSFRKGMFDTHYAVYVTPGQETRIVFRSRHFTSRMLFVMLGVVVVLGVVAGLSGFVLRWLG